MHRTFLWTFLAGKADGARFKVGLENVYARVFDHSTDQIFTNVQGVPGPALDTMKLQKKLHSSHIIGGESGCHVGDFKCGERGRRTRSRGWMVVNRMWGTAGSLGRLSARAGSEGPVRDKGLYAMCVDSSLDTCLGCWA